MFVGGQIDINHIQRGTFLKAVWLGCALPFNVRPRGGVNSALSAGDRRLHGVGTRFKTLLAEAFKHEHQRHERNRTEDKLFHMFGEERFHTC